MNMSTAINVFANAVVDKRKIPFEIEVPTNDNIKFMETINAMRNEVKKNNLNELSLDGINKIIKDTRQKRNKK